MLSLEVLESRMSALMETVVRVAVTELGRLLENCSTSANVQQLSAPGVEMKIEEEESEVSSSEERRLFNTAIMNQFTSLMEASTKDAVDKFLILVKTSMCEAEDAAAEQRARLNEETKQSCMKVKAVEVTDRQQSLSKSPRQRRKKKKKASKPAEHNDHIYYREEPRTEEEPRTVEEPRTEELTVSVTKPAGVDTHESNSGSPSLPEVLLTEETTELSEDDGIQDDTGATTPEIKKRITRTGPLKCPSCDRSFARKCWLERHYLCHSKPHACSECGKRFAVQRGLIAHTRKHTGEKPYKCSDCGTEFAYKYTFERHIREHSRKKTARSLTMCKLCENHFSGALALQRHRCCALKKTFVCSICPETFECRQSLADHENLHSGDRDFVCEMCGESFFTSLSLATHRVTHALKENWEVLGLECSDLSVRKNKLSKHTGEKPFSCQVCGKGCSHQSALKHHMLTHTGEKPYVCETCGKRCGHASALQNHMRIHLGKQPYQPFVCNVCGKKFPRATNLKYHMHIHTGEKPYACNQCDKTFRQPTTLRLHMVTHSGKKMYSCNICSKRFTHLNSLRIHTRVHTGEKPYCCLVCGERFMHNSDFNKHRKGHLSDKPEDGQSEKTDVKI